MATTVAPPPPQPEPVLYSILGPHSKNPPEGLEGFLSHVKERTEEDAFLPLLRASDLSDAFPRSYQTYHHWTAAASQALVAALGIDAVLGLAPDVIGQMKDLVTRPGGRPLHESAAKAYVGALDIAEMIFERMSRIRELGIDKELEFAQGLHRSLFVAMSLCANTVAYYCREPLPLLKNQEDENVSIIAKWAFQYAELVYLDWGVAELNLGLSSPLSPPSTPV